MVRPARFDAKIEAFMKRINNSPFNNYWRYSTYLLHLAINSYNPSPLLYISEYNNSDEKVIRQVNNFFSKEAHYWEISEITYADFARAIKRPETIDSWRELISKMTHPCERMRNGYFSNATSSSFF